MFKPLLLLVLISTLLLAGCAGARLDATQSSVAVMTPEHTAEASLPAPAVTVAPLLPPTAAPTEEAPLPKTIYRLDASLNYDTHHLAVEETITYTNGSPDHLPNLVLMVDSAYYPGVFHLDRIEWADGHPVQYDASETGQLRLALPQPLAPGKGVELSLSYALDLPSPTPSPTTRPVPFGYTARQTNLVDWYPFIPPYQAGHGWLAHRAGYFGEHLVYESADFEVSFRLEGRSAGLVVAASAPEQIDGDWRRYRLDSARNFALSVSADYQVGRIQVGEVEVLGYSFPSHTAAGEAVLQTTAQSLELFSRLFGPYSRSTLTVVEADFLDGMEYDGLYFLSNGFYNLYTGTPGEYLITIAAHETAHQWWYGRLGNDQAIEPWLDEALCTYSERLFYEHLHPEVLDWWWTYRVNFYEPRGWVNGSIYDFGGFPEPYRSYRDAVYLNGAVFLEELRQTIGDEPFTSFLKDYAERGNSRIVTADDFFSILEEHTQADLVDLKAKFFSNP